MTQNVIFVPVTLPSVKSGGLFFYLGLSLKGEWEIICDGFLNNKDWILVDRNGQSQSGGGVRSSVRGRAVTEKRVKNNQWEQIVEGNT